MRLLPTQACVDGSIPLLAKSSNIVQTTCLAYNDDIKSFSNIFRLLVRRYDNLFNKNLKKNIMVVELK